MNVSALDILEQLLADSFLFLAEDEGQPQADTAGGAPPEQPPADPEPSDADLAELVDALGLTSEIFLFAPETSSNLLAAAGPDEEGYEPPASPVPGPLFSDLASYVPPMPAPAPGNSSDFAPDFQLFGGIEPAFSASVNSIRVPGPDEEGYEPPAPPPDPPRAGDIAGFEPPPPPPEEPNLADIAPDSLLFA